MKRLSITVFCLLVLAGGLVTWWARWRSQSQHSISYEILNTVRYSDTGGNFSVQTAGVLTVAREHRNADSVAYTYTFQSKTQAPMHEGVAHVSLPPVVLYRDPSSERFTGGAPLLRNLATVSNEALNQVKTQIVVDGPAQPRVFELPKVKGFPQRLSYSIKVISQRLPSVGNALLVLAISEPFDYTLTGKADTSELTAEHRMLLLTDAAMERVIFSVSRFVAHPTASPNASLTIEYAMHQLLDGRPVSTAGISAQLMSWVNRIGLEAPGERTTSLGLPSWAMHSLAVRDQAELIAGAAIEGKPNFAITATIGSILLIDAGVSAGTKMLHEMGVIDWDWKGIPNYVGGGIGLMAAKGFTALSGYQVDVDRWQSAGGIAGDIAAVFLPSNVSGTGVKFTLGGTEAGVQIIKTGSLAGKALRISKDGLELVQAQRGWLASAEVSEKLLQSKKLLSLGRALLAANELSWKQSAPQRLTAVQQSSGFSTSHFSPVEIPSGNPRLRWEAESREWELFTEGRILLVGLKKYKGGVDPCGVAAYDTLTGDKLWETSGGQRLSVGFGDLFAARTGVGVLGSSLLLLTDRGFDELSRVDGRLLRQYTYSASTVRNSRVDWRDIPHVDGDLIYLRCERFLIVIDSSTFEQRAKFTIDQPSDYASYIHTPLAFDQHRLYTGSRQGRDYHVVALRKDGEKVWDFPLAGPLNGHFVLSGDRLYVQEKEALVALDCATGNEVFRLSGLESPKWAIGPSVIVGATWWWNNSILVGYDARSGNELWRRDAINSEDPGTFTPPSIFGSDVVVGRNGLNVTGLACYDARSGNKKWRIVYAPLVRNESISCADEVWGYSYPPLPSASGTGVIVRRKPKLLCVEFGTERTRAGPAIYSTPITSASRPAW